MLASYELKENGTRTHYRQFLRLGTIEIQERNSQDQVVAQNLWNPTAPGGIGGLLERTVGAKQYYHYDHNGNPVQTVNAKGEVTDNLFYTPFGELISGTINHTQPFGHSTKRGNFKSGLLYFGYRFYVPHMERWLNRDPIGTNGGLNIYAYVEQNPIMYVDDNGLRPTPAIRPVRPPQHYPSNRPREHRKDLIRELQKLMREGSKTARQLRRIAELKQQIEEYDKLLHPKLPVKCVQYFCPWDSDYNFCPTPTTSVNRTRSTLNGCICVNEAIAW
jgi:RHS repeat-associated protein